MRQIDLIATLNSSQIMDADFEELSNLGMDMLRLNCSHISIEELYKLTKRIREANLKIMLDLPGHEIRLQGLDKNLPVKTGELLHIGKTSQALRCNFDAWESLSPGMEVYLQDSEIQAWIGKIHPDAIDIKISKGGILRPNASISFLGLESTKLFDGNPDIPYLDFALEQEVEIVVLSHIDHPHQVMAIKEHLQGFKKLIATKIETKNALDHLDELIDLSDLMVLGRGDLGTSIPYAHIPFVQKKLIKSCRAKGKTVYIATEILSSLAYQNTPSRSEVSDIATAIMDGAGGFILTNETATSTEPNSVISIGKELINQVQLKIEEESKPRYPFIPSLEQSISFELLLSKLAQVGERIWQRGWAEANAGNVSIRLTDYGSHEDNPILFLVSKTGSRYRQFGKDTMSNLTIIEVRGDSFRCLDPHAKPSSEWCAHLNLHNHFRKNGLKRRVVLHSHPDDVICLAQLPFFEDKVALYNELKDALPELPLFLDTGIHICDLHPPGSDALALASVCGLKDEKALIWKKHGLLTFGASLDEAFDSMEVMVKASKILLCERQVRA